MRKLGFCLFLLLASMIEVRAESYCVMNGNDGTVVAQSNMHEQQSVASISKVMTAIVAIEQGDLQASWQVSDAILKAEGSSIYLHVGQSVTLEELLYGLMLRSGNDAAIEIAMQVGGSEANFVQMMNDKAKELGMQDTLFRNPSGLDEEDGGNCSSAYDMALLTRYAMNNETFAQITGSPYYDARGTRWQNKNKLLFQYDAATGGKTGYTKKAGRTLITTASRNDMDSIVVTLGIGDDFAFHKSQHEDQFDAYEVYTILKQGSYVIQGMRYDVDQSIQVVLAKDQSCDLKVHTYLQDDRLIIEVEKNAQNQQYEITGVKLNQKKRWFQ